MAKTNDFERLKDQSFTNGSREYAQALRNRAKGGDLSIKQLAEQVLGDSDRPDKEEQIVKWFSGWETPDETMHNRILDVIGIATQSQISQEISHQQREAYDKLSDKKKKNKKLVDMPYKLSLSMQLRSRLGDMRDTAEIEQFDVTSTPAFDARTYLAPAGKRKPSIPQELANTRQELYKILTEQNGLELRAFIEAPIGEDDTLKDLFTALKHHFGMTNKALSEEMGFEHALVGNWIRDNDASIPRRENFETAQTFMRNNFPDSTAADKFTELYIREALQRFKKSTMFRNLPIEFWEAKVLLTNDPAYAESEHAPSWIGEVKPCEHAGEYLKSIRRSHGVRRDELSDVIEYNTLVSLESKNKASPDNTNAVLDRVKAMDSEYRKGETALFDGTVYAGLTQPSYRDKPLNLTNGGVEYKGKGPKVGIIRRLNTIAKKVDPDLNADDLTMIGVPKTLGECQDMDVDALIRKAQRYYKVATKAEEEILRRELTSLQEDASKGLSSGRK